MIQLAKKNCRQGFGTLRVSAYSREKLEEENQERENGIPYKTGGEIALIQKPKPPLKGYLQFQEKKLFTLICVIFISLEILSDFLVGFNDVCLEGFNLCCAVECSALQCSRVVECSCTS